MKNFGIICEYNPFHRGHAKQLAYVASQGRSVCLMSGSYVQRGEPAVIDKYERAKAAVLCGADLVLELPLLYVLSSAEGFADGGVEMFTRLGCVDGLCFGSEWGKGKELMDCAKLLLSEDFSLELRKHLKKGISFPKARQLAVDALGGTGSLLEKPNNILGIEYCKALLRRESPISPYAIYRAGDYHGGQDPENPSASFLREHPSWENYVPAEAYEVFASAPRYSTVTGERAWLSRLRAMEKENFEALPYGSEGLWRKLMQAVRTSSSLEEILEKTKSKRYTMTRLKRMLLCAYLGVTEEMLTMEIPYLRVLAMNERGQEIVAGLRKNENITLLHPGQEAPDCPYRTLERRAEDLYELFR
ncbi:MAG: nucleotidyltransferase family protein, partial [Oscillospiraceae bacterium]|nr:nucleotidyltransferase family protein [Oscillospiraceae bacterium]